MDFLRTISARLAALFRGRSLDRELDAELRSHVAMAAELNVQKGMKPEEARRQAALDFGGVEQTKELFRERRGFPLLETVLQDLHYGLRILKRSLGFTALAVLCLTLGIGANAAVFSWIEGVLLRPFPLVLHQDRMYALTGTMRGNADLDDLSWPDFLDLQSNSTLAEAFVAEKITGAALGVGERTERVTGSVVSANYFSALGVNLRLGRGFVPEENLGRNAHPVVVISSRIWKEHFGGDREVIGKPISLDRVPHTVIGVAPEGFYGTFVGYAFDFWVPASMQEAFDYSNRYLLEDRGGRWIEGFVFLKPGVSSQSAQQELNSITQRLEATYPVSNRGFGVRLFPLWRTPFNNAGALAPTLGMALAVVFAVLLIACANVGNLLLVRSFARRRELTIRLSIGASRFRIIRQLLTEGLILSILAGAGSLFVAFACRNLLVRLVPPRGTPMLLEGQLDWRLLGFTASICVFAALAFSLVPALQCGKIDLVTALKSESSGLMGSHTQSWVRSSFVVIQVCLSFLLLAGAGLVLQSLQKIRDADPGFTIDRNLVTSVSLSAAGYDDQRARNFQNELLPRIQAMPAVQSAALARIPVFSYVSYSSAPIAVDGYVPPPDQQVSASYNEISPGYFSTMGIPLLSGRDFSLSDDEKNAPVAIVNEAMVEKYWHGQDPVGERLRVNERWMMVVGVASLSRYRNFLEAPQPFFYVPLRQNPSPLVSVHMRTDQPLRDVATALEREIHALDSDLPVFRVITMREQVDRTTASQRIAVSLLSVFGFLALLLSAVGLYGVMSYSVSQSTRELGLRMALGAHGYDLLQFVMSRGLVLTAIGLFLGLALALGSTRLLGYLLYKVSPRDPLAFAAAIAVMVVTACVACFLPAWRATRTDPVQALRYQ